MLYALGSNGAGQLGLGHDEDVSEPTPIAATDGAATWQVSQLAAGGNHTVLLCNDGKVRATGCNEDGRCCGYEARSLNRFVEVVLPLDTHGQFIRVKQVAACWSSTTILCEGGALYSCGTGNSGELGLGPGVVNAPDLRCLPDFAPHGEKVVALASSMAHIVAIMSNGEVYGWGRGRQGQIGEPAEDVWWPRRVEHIGFRAMAVACGKDFTMIAGGLARPTFAVLGCKKNDRFGIRTGSKLSINDCKSIVASWGSIFILDNAGSITAWGRDDHGQLPHAGISDVEAVAAGSEHGLALTRAGKVLAWGWGEHGNCGLPIDDSGDVKSSSNELNIRRLVSRVFAGCATSFLETLDR